MLHSNGVHSLLLFAKYFANLWRRMTLHGFSFLVLAWLLFLLEWSLEGIGVDTRKDIILAEGYHYAMWKNFWYRYLFLLTGQRADLPFVNPRCPSPWSIYCFCICITWETTILSHLQNLFLLKFDTFSTGSSLDLPIFSS